MTKEIKIEALTRDKKNGKANKIREAGFLPANVYGSGVDNKNIKVKELDLKRVFSEAGESHLIDLSIDNKQAVKVIIKDVQKNPTNDNVIHVDFYQVDMNKKITTEIPLNFIGESKAVKEIGGILIRNFNSLEIRCLPGDLVDKIDVDLTGLNNFHDVIRTKDITFPNGIELVSEADEIIVSVVEPAKEEIEEKEEADEGEEGAEEKEEAGEEEAQKDAKDLPAEAGTPKEESEQKNEKKREEKNK